MTMPRLLKSLALLLCAPAVVLTVSCKDSSSGGGVVFVQVERLARPAINEGLVISNDFLVAFNSIPPSQDLDPEVTGDVLGEVVATLDAVDQLDGNDNVDPGAIAGAFLPDVMRIDTTRQVPVGTEAYPFAFNALGSPICGRKLEDDVIDTTLTVVVGAPVGDNVSYGGVPGNPAQPGHKLLFGQTSPGGTATFPFLATPN